jgi:hypothetical protein
MITVNSSPQKKVSSPFFVALIRMRVSDFSLSGLCSAGRRSIRAAESAFGHSHYLTVDLLADSLDRIPPRSSNFCRIPFALTFACLSSFRRRPHEASAACRCILSPCYRRSDPHEQKQDRHCSNYIPVHDITFFLDCDVLKDYRLTGYTLAIEYGPNMEELRKLRCSAYFFLTMRYNTNRVISEV